MKPILSWTLWIVAALLFSSVAIAEDEPTVGVLDAPLEGGAPDLVEKTLDEALQTLDELGLEPRIITIAAGDVGVVREQAPAAGDAIQTGDEMTIVVGIEALIQTIVPDLIGRDESALDLLRETYFLRVQYVEGDQAKAGLVIAQNPKAGATHPARGLLILEIVEGHAIVPSIVGKVEAEARKLILGARLRIDVTYVDDPAAAAGTVLSQDPKSGIEALPMSTVQARVAGPAPETEEATPSELLVPDLTGLKIEDAQKALHALDLVPAPEFRESEDATPWTVLEQDPVVGTKVEAGAIVTFVVAKAAPEPAVELAEVPNVVGAPADQAAGLIYARGLQARRALRLLPNTNPQRVAEQYPAAGALVPPGTRVTFVLPQVAVMPHILGLACPRAQNQLQLAGFLSLGIQMGTGPGPAEVTWQEVPAGALVARGSTVRFRCTVVAIPDPLVHVPRVLGLTRAQAHARLSAEGFRVETEHVGGTGPMTEVFQQHPGAGTLQVQGSTVKVRYRRRGIAPTLERVPNVVGRTPAQARTRLESAGFRAEGHRVGPVLGAAMEVFDQSPNAGSMHPRGAVVHYRYRVTPATAMKRVPGVLGMTKDAAKARLEGEGFRVTLRRVGGVGPTTRVVDTDPNAGTLRPTGATVLVEYRRSGLAPVGRPIPNVVGMSLAQARSRLGSRGFQVNAIAVGGLGPVTRVVSTDPAAGQRRAPGTVVRVRYQRTPGPIGPGGGLEVQVRVPNVVGMTRNQARARLEATGLKMRVSLPSLGSRVRTQNPTAGTRVARDSTVRVRLRP